VVGAADLTVTKEALSHRNENGFWLDGSKILMDSAIETLSKTVETFLAVA
jgi:hypothetical protein